MLNKFQLFDSHLHIINSQFPLIENNGYLPDEFTHEDYLNRTTSYEICGGAVVSGSFQGYDQSYLINALENLGNGFVGVTQLPHTVSDEEIINLDKVGIRAVRFNIKRGGSEELKHLTTMAHRIYDLARWHVELYVDSKDLPDLYNTLINLPLVSVDHLGLSKEGLNTIKKLIEYNVKLKATGFGRVNFDVKGILPELNSINPSALMFGTDLPSTRAPRKYEDNDFLLVIDALGEDDVENIFSKNAIEFYKPNR